MSEGHFSRIANVSLTEVLQIIWIRNGRSIQTGKGGADMDECEDRKSSVIYALFSTRNGRQRPPRQREPRRISTYWRIVDKMGAV